MRHREETQPLTRLRRESTALLEELQQHQHPMLITRRQREVAVLMTPQLYHSLQEQIRLLTALVQGQADLTAGDLRPISSLLHDLRAELEA